MKGHTFFFATTIAFVMAFTAYKALTSDTASSVTCDDMTRSGALVCHQVDGAPVSFTRDARVVWEKIPIHQTPDFKAD